MTDSPSHLALREVRADFTNPKGLLALGGVGLLLGLSGPFQTFAHLTMLPRLLYWVCVVFATYAAGAYVNAYLHYKGGEKLERLSARLPVMGLATGCSVMGVLVIINSVTFGWIYPTVGTFLTSFIFVVTISTIVVGLIMLLAPLPEAAQSAPALLDRLPFDKRGALVSLSVEDHYVKVTTIKGTQMLLMRLSDAIGETGSSAGLQVHRSHWVAKDQVRKVTRTGDRAILTLKDAREIPVSRSYLPALRDAGLLPKSANG